MLRAGGMPRKQYNRRKGKLPAPQLTNLTADLEDQEFLRPVITPYELIAALGDELQWPAGYSLDFDSVLRAEAHIGGGVCVTACI